MGVLSKSAQLAPLDCFYGGEEFSLIDIFTNLDEFELSINIEAKTGKVFLKPLVGGDHGEKVASTSMVKVVFLADDRFEVDVGFVSEFVPVEVGDGGDVFFADLD